MKDAAHDATPPLLKSDGDFTFPVMRLPTYLHPEAAISGSEGRSPRDAGATQHPELDPFTNRTNARSADVRYDMYPQPLTQSLLASNLAPTSSASRLCILLARENGSGVLPRRFALRARRPTPDTAL